MTEQTTRGGTRRWGFLLAEMVLIVASILLAFALDSWWDERQARAEEQEILQGLNKEFREIRDQLNRRLGQYDSGVLRLSHFVEASRKGAWEDEPGSIDGALAALISPPTTDLGTGVLDALISAGRLELLGNRELRRLLAGWDGVFAEVNDDEEFSRAYVFNALIPYLTRHGVPMSGVFQTWYEQGLPGRSLGDDPALLQRLLNDPEFQSLLEVRLGFWLHMGGEYHNALEAVDTILAEINRSIAGSQ